MFNPAFKIFWSIGKGACAGFAWLAAITIDENTLVPIGSAVFVLLGVWSLSARLQRMEDGIKEIRRRLDKLEEN